MIKVVTFDELPESLKGVIEDCNDTGISDGGKQLEILYCENDPEYKTAECIVRDDRIFGAFNYAYRKGVTYTWLRPSEVELMHKALREEK